MSISKTEEFATAHETAQVSRWGHSLAVRLSVPVVEQLGLAEGATVRLVARAPKHSEATPRSGLAEDQLPYTAGAPPSRAGASPYSAGATPSSAGAPMALDAKIGKWGNSFAVRLPRALAGELGLSEGSDVRLHVGEGGMLDIARELTVEELFEAVRLLRGTLPADWKMSREEMNSRSAESDE